MRGSHRIRHFDRGDSELIHCMCKEADLSATIDSIIAQLSSVPGAAKGVTESLMAGWAATTTEPPEPGEVLIRVTFT